MISSPGALAARFSRWSSPNLAMGSMLFALHAALVFGLGTGASRATLLAHFGLFLLWQPVWQGARHLVPSRALMVVGGGALLAWSGTWWLTGLWIALLFALIGGNVPGMRSLRPRLAPLLAAVYLLMALLILVVPNLFGVAEMSPLLALLGRYGLLLPLLLILVLPGHAQDPGSQGMDLVSSVLLFLMVIVLVLGTLFVQQVTRGDYALALVQTVIGIATILFLMSWLWDPRGGFSGVGQLVSRYFLSLGLPFERWMHSLANLAEQESDPDRFVDLAVTQMRELPWLAAVEWETTDGTAGRSGGATAHMTEFATEGLRLRLYTKWRPGPAFRLHMHLLARLLGDYHDAKVREQALRNATYMQAIHETGSRVTHDVKNLLQSLRSLCAAVDATPGADPEALRRLIQRQLPQIAQRLQNTLEKLDGRAAATLPPDVSAADWWRNLVQRYAHERVVFQAEPIEPDAGLPAELFDRVAENLLQNALEKQRRGEANRVTLRLDRAAAGFRMEVTDDGEPVPEALARHLLAQPVASESGLGVGLYQCARQAAAAGHQLELAINEPGCVRFKLAPTAR